MGLTRITSDGITDGTIIGTDLATNVDLVDNQKLRLGTSDDLQIYHDGSNSYLQDSGTGHLIIRSSHLQVKNSDNTELIAKFIQDGAVELYYDHQKKFETRSNGVTVTGYTYSDGVTIGNGTSEKYLAGDSNQLQMYHTGSSGNAYINNSQGTTLIGGSIVSFTNQANNAFLIRAVDGGTAELYHNGSKKFETTSVGASVTGALAATSLSATGGITGTGGNFVLGDTSGTSNNRIKLGAGQDLQIYHDGTASYIDNSTGSFFVRGDTIKLRGKSADEDLIEAFVNGSVRLYHNNALKFETTSTGVSVTGGITTSGSSTINEDFTFVAANGEDLRFDKSDSAFEFNDNFKCVFGNSSDLQIYHDGSNSHIAEAGTGVLKISGSAGVYINKHDNTETMAAFLHDAGVELYHNNVKIFETISTGIQVTGNVTPTGYMKLVDNMQIYFGTGNDLEIYHDGSNSYIKDAGTGSLLIRGSTVSIQSVSGEAMIEGVADGAVTIKHDNSTKLQTTSGGVTVTGTCTATSFAGDGSSLTGITSQGKNLIINGGMRIHQRGTASYTLNSGNTNEFIVDRFRVFSGAGTIVASQDTTVPSGQGFAKSIKLDCTVADASTEAEGYIEYKPEGQNFFHLAYGTSGAKTITVSFWVKSSSAATYGFYYYIPSAGPRVYQTTFAISSANTWEKKTITIAGDTGGSGFNNDASAGAEIRIYFNGTSGQRGSSNQNSWGTNTSNRLPSATNLVGSTSNDFFFTGFQLEVGSQATDYDFCSYAKELSYCQRYYWKIATNTYRRVNGYKRHDANSFWELKSPVPMRTAPSPTLLVSGTFTNFQTNLNTTQTSPVVNEWNTDTGMGLLHVQSTWSDTHKSIPSWEGYSIEFSAEL